VSAESELDGFVGKFAPDMQERIRACRASMAERLPDAVQLVWDNYNFLVISFGPTRRPSEAIYSLAAQARGVNLCFLQRGPELPDPTGILRGSGTRVRNVPLGAAEDLHRADIATLIDAADRLAAVPIEAAQGPELVIQSVSTRQRPRR